MASETWQVQFKYLRALLENNLASSLPGFNGVEEVAPPVGDNLPLVGIQWSHTEETPGDAHRYTKQTSYFDIVALFTAPFDPTVTDGVRELKITAENALNDEQGRGLLVLLRSDPTLGGFATWSAIGNYGVVIGRDPQNEAQLSAHVAISLRAEAELGPF